MTQEYEDVDLQDESPGDVFALFVLEDVPLDVSISLHFFLCKIADDKSYRRSTKFYKRQKNVKRTIVFGLPTPTTPWLISARRAILDNLYHKSISSGNLLSSERA